MVLLLLLLILLVPYLASAMLGQAEAGLTGLAALHGAAESVYCGDGLTPAGTILPTLFCCRLKRFSHIIGGKEGQTARPEMDKSGLENQT